MSGVNLEETPEHFVVDCDAYFHIWQRYDFFVGTELETLMDKWNQALLRKAV
ncbi:MAG: hypothetical protein Crog4KO_36280 [Crocinitomicaceae bacterium]